MSDQATDFIYARPSAVPNAGQDLPDSARHRRNQWRTLREAEEDGSAVFMMTRDELLKNEPHCLLDTIAESNAIVHYAAHCVMLCFPPTPGKALSRSSSSSAEDRAIYYEVYKELKTRIEEDAQRIEDPKILITGIYEWCFKKINDIRSVNYYSPVANSLVSTYKRTQTWRQKGKANSAILKVTELQDQITDRGLYSEEVLEAVKSLIKGTPFSKVFGITKGKTNLPKQFKDEDDYGLPVERTGGKPFTGTAESLLITYGLCGLQFGNSLPDKERIEHVRCTGESLSDLADMLGWQTPQIGIKNLGLAIGARGRSSALAHYEPTKHVINLTRAGGSGSLAHEWFHALDYRLGQKAKDSSNDKISVLAHNNKIKFLSQYASRYNFSKVEASSDVYLAMEQIFQLMQSSGYSTRLTEALHQMVVAKQMPAKKMSYWNSPEEKTARGFEQYIQYLLEAHRQKNTYLSGSQYSSVRTTPFETKEIAPGYQALFAACKKLEI